MVCQRKQQIPKHDLIAEADQNKYQNYWQLPQGGIENHEDLVTAAKREAAEETGLKNLELIKISEKTNTYFWNNALRKFRFNKKYAHKGQHQHVAYFKFTGNNRDIKFDSTKDKELINYRWAAVGELDKIIHPERINLVKIVQEDLKEMREKAII